MALQHSLLLIYLADFSPFLFFLLTQPYGSLFYVRPEAPFGRAVFFFHRLNPLACVVESVLIIYAFFGITQMAIHKHHRQALMEPRNTSLTSKLVIGAKAILFLREHPRVPKHRRKIAVRQYAISMTAVFNMSSGTHPGDQTQHQGDHLQNTNFPDNVYSTEENAPRLSPPEQETPSPMIDIDQVDYTGRTRGRATEEVAEIGVLDHGPVLDSRTLRKSSYNGSGTGALLIGLLTFVGIIFVIFKTVSVIIPWWTKATIWCLVLGWIAPQSLLSISQLGDETRSDATQLLHTALAVENKITGPMVRISTFLLTLPLLGYLSVVTSWQTIEMPNDAFDWVLGFFCSFLYVEVFFWLCSTWTESQSSQILLLCSIKVKEIISLAWVPSVFNEIQEYCTDFSSLWHQPVSAVSWRDSVPGEYTCFTTPAKNSTKRQKSTHQYRDQRILHPQPHSALTTSFSHWSSYHSIHYGFSFLHRDQALHQLYLVCQHWFTT